MPANATPTFRHPAEGDEIVNRVVLERVAEDLEELDELVWADGGDVARIRELAAESLMLTLSLLEAV